jgi:hypothetical protein
MDVVPVTKAGYPASTLSICAFSLHGLTLMSNISTCTNSLHENEPLASVARMPMRASMCMAGPLWHSSDSTRRHQLASSAPARVHLYCARAKVCVLPNTCVSTTIFGNLPPDNVPSRMLHVFIPVVRMFKALELLCQYLEVATHKGVSVFSTFCTPKAHSNVRAVAGASMSCSVAWLLPASLMYTDAAYAPRRMSHHQGLPEGCTSKSSIQQGVRGVRPPHPQMM